MADQYSGKLLNRLNFVFFIILFCGLCNLNAISAISINTAIESKPIVSDTVLCVNLKNRQYKNNQYKVSYLYNLDHNGLRIDSTKRIEIIQNNSKKLAFLFIPNSIDVKNLSVSKLIETKTGFKICFRWGGGNSFSNSEFYFIFNKNNFYIKHIYKLNYTLDPENDTRKNIYFKKLIPFDQFDITPYL